jgi:hypothetical protein
VSIPPPFDVNLPSPLETLMRLRADARESVVRDSDPTDIQRRMAPPGELEDSLWNALGEADSPRLLVLTGSAGAGKSVVINHLLEKEKSSRAGRIGKYIADATHSDTPNQQQSERLSEFFAPFADDVPTADGPCRLIALNTGMALRFFHDLPNQLGSRTFHGLEALLRKRLGLPPGWNADYPVPHWLSDAVLVVNLDHRSTAGNDGDLFDHVLGRLDPENVDGVFAGRERCTTCSVISYCWPMANAAMISSDESRAALNRAAGEVVLKRGRQLSLRLLWDAAAELTLSGLDVSRSDTPSDPCFAIADVARRSAESEVVDGLACNNALNYARAGTFVAEIADHDPTYRAMRRSHELIAEAGLNLARDASTLRDSLSSGTVHPAVERVAEAIRVGRVEMRGRGRVLARAVWLHGDLVPESSLDARFARALESMSDSDAVDTADDALYAIEEGLAAVFGLTSGSEHYFPTTTPGPGDTADLLVHIRMVDDGWIQVKDDPTLTANPTGSNLVGYRPIALVLSVDESRIGSERLFSVDYPLWQLLIGATAGSSPSSVELEKFRALREAVYGMGFIAATGKDSERMPLLVRDRTPNGRRFRLVNRAKNSIRATEVS